MPTWPTLWPSLLDGRSNERIDTRFKDITWTDNNQKDAAAENYPLTARQK